MKLMLLNVFRVVAVEVVPVIDREDGGPCIVIVRWWHDGDGGGCRGHYLVLLEGDPLDMFDGVYVVRHATLLGISSNHCEHLLGDEPLSSKHHNADHFLSDKFDILHPL